MQILQKPIQSVLLEQPKWMDKGRAPHWDGCMDGSMGGWVSGWVRGCILMGAYVDGWISGQMGGWVDGL